MRIAIANASFHKADATPRRFPQQGNAHQAGETISSRWTSVIAMLRDLTSPFGAVLGCRVSYKGRFFTKGGVKAQQIW